jgi:hypothetical protein
MGPLVGRVRTYVVDLSQGKEILCQFSAFWERALFADCVTKVGH